MSVSRLSAELFSQLEKAGLRGRLVPAHRSRDVQAALQYQHDQGLFDPRFYQIELTGFDWELPAALPGAQSILVIAAPQPQVRVTFELDGQARPAIIPPTYSYRTDAIIRTVLERLLEPNGYHLARARLPNKSLAVRSGLAQYGKNNITYVAGLGSFQRLAAFYTELPCLQDPWDEPHSMDLCQTCRACLKACPTGAISTDRFLLHAERCLTFLNEFPGEFPDWVEPAWHHAVVGCLACQRACPANREVVDWVEEGAAFSAEETHLLLQGASREQLPESTATSLERLGMLEYLELLPRNLRTLFGTASG